MAIDRGFTTLAAFTRGRGAYVWPLPAGPFGGTATPTVTGQATATATAQATSTVAATATAPGDQHDPAERHRHDGRHATAVATATRTVGRAHRDGHAVRHHLQRRASDRLLLYAGAVSGLPRRDQRLRGRHVPPVQQHHPLARWSRSSCSASTSRPTRRRTTNTFADVPPANPFFSVIEAAAHANIVSGYACGRPRRALRQPEPALLPPVRQRDARPVVQDRRGRGRLDADQPGRRRASQDVFPNTAFYTFVETAYCHGIISGYSCGGPGEPCGTREQALLPPVQRRDPRPDRQDRLRRAHHVNRLRGGSGQISGLARGARHRGAPHQADLARAGERVSPALCIPAVAARPAQAVLYRR